MVFPSRCSLSERSVWNRQRVLSFAQFIHLSGVGAEHPHDLLLAGEGQRVLWPEQPGRGVDLQRYAAARLRSRQRISEPLLGEVRLEPRLLAHSAGETSAGGPVVPETAGLAPGYS